MIEQIVTGSHLKRIDNIIQWQERDVFQRESVSQHSFKVSVFTRIILEDVLGNIESIEFYKFKLSCVTHALFHDFDEAIFLRDISHSIKYNEFNGKEIKEAINHYVSHQFYEEFKNDDESDDSLNMLHQSIVDIEQSVKDVVKVADWLALLYFCRRELALGNDNFQKTYEYCKISLLSSANHMIYSLSNLFSISNPQYFLESINKIITSDFHGTKDY